MGADLAEIKTMPFVFVQLLQGDKLEVVFKIDDASVDY